MPSTPSSYSLIIRTSSSWEPLNDSTLARTDGLCSSWGSSLLSPSDQALGGWWSCHVNAKLCTFCTSAYNMATMDCIFQFTYSSSPNYWLHTLGLNYQHTQIYTHSTKTLQWIHSVLFLHLTYQAFDSCLLFLVVTHVFLLVYWSLYCLYTAWPFACFWIFILWFRFVSVWQYLFIF